MAHTSVTPSAPTADWAVTGMLAGVVAGIVMAAFEMIAAGAMGMGTLAPLRMIAGIVLGADAMGPGTPVGTAVIAGILVHLVLSGLYGAIFGTLVHAVGLRRNKTGIFWVGAVFGLALWLVNFYVFAPALFPWFTEANPWVQFFAHTLFFGGTLGGMLDVRLTLPAVEVPGT